MIEKSFEEVHDEKWKSIHLPDPLHELYLLRQVIPWEKIIRNLSPYYSEKKGRYGRSLRMMTAVVLLQKLLKLGDRTIISYVQENRYGQYFCNVSDEKRAHFLNHSTLVRFRKRLGSQGTQSIENLCFENLRRSGVIKNDASLIDSSVLANNVIYPNDVDLLYKGFLKMESWCRHQKITPWWNHSWIKSRWRAYNLGKKKERLRFLLEFQEHFIPASRIFQKKVRNLSDSQEKKEESIGWKCFES